MIRTNDIVWVAKLPSCGCDAVIGDIFQVAGIHDFPESRCIHCGVARQPAQVAHGHSSGFAVETFRLQKIPPLGELEGQRTQEPIRDKVST